LQIISSHNLLWTQVKRIFTIVLCWLNFIYGNFKGILNTKNVITVKTLFLCIYIFKIWPGSNFCMKYSFMAVGTVPKSNRKFQAHIYLDCSLTWNFIKNGVLQQVLKAYLCFHLFEQLTTTCLLFCCSSSLFKFI